eukprot:scaffold20869_cov120-Isochrysis_galbana.AAC.4
MCVRQCGNAHDSQHHQGYRFSWTVDTVDPNADRPLAAAPQVYSPEQYWLGFPSKPRALIFISLVLQSLESVKSCSYCGCMHVLLACGVPLTRHPQIVHYSAGTGTGPIDACACLYLQGCLRPSRQGSRSHLYLYTVHTLVRTTYAGMCGFICLSLLLNLLCSAL